MLNDLLNRSHEVSPMFMIVIAFVCFIILAIIIKKHEK